LENTPSPVFVPRFQLTHKLLTGKLIELETKFAVFKSFSSDQQIGMVTVSDADGEHQIGVEQTPDFQIEAEIKKLLKKEIRYDKLSANLASIAHDYEKGGLTTVKASLVPVTPLSIPSVGGTPEAIIFIRCKEDAEINLNGVQVNSPQGEIRTAKISLDALETLSQDENIFQLDAAVKYSFLNDIAAEKTQLKNFRLQHPDLNGEGVIIGVIDSGIDSLHPSFAGRILSIWDQEIQGPGWQDENSPDKRWGKKSYGQVLTGEFLKVSIDKVGHGTHVAAIAAGDDEEFQGVAPGADLIIVKTSLNQAHIADGIEYIFSEADRLGRPAVVNLSIGSHLNAHDGTDFLSARIKDIYKRVTDGKIIVAAAGNEGNNNIRGAIVIPPKQTVELEFAILQNSAGFVPPWALFSGWYQGNTTCEISVRPPKGIATPYKGVSDTESPTQVSIVGNVIITITTPSVSASPNGDREIQIKLESVSKELPKGKWEIIIRNTGENEASLDIWSMVDERFKDAEFFPAFKRDDMKIGSPGCTGEVITVAAYTTRNRWIDAKNNDRPKNPFNVDTIWEGSSPGPLRNGSLKPDIAAPGVMIISALSSLSTPSEDTLINQKFVVKAGTSMACPFIAGLCALLLQRDQTLTADAIKTILRKNGQIPEKDPETHDIKWGYGLVDVAKL
jgi:subtilisin family serine protease